MSPTHSSKGGKRYRYYVCSQAQKRGWDHCPSQSVPASAMERILVEQISKVGQDQERLMKILQEAFRQRRTRLADLETERRRLERELKILTESLPSEIDSVDRDKQPALGHETLRENIGHLERHLAEIQKQAFTLQQQPLGVEETTQTLVALEQRIGELPVMEQARVIQSMVQRIDYDGSTGKLAVALDPVGLVAALEELTKQDQETSR